MERKRVKLVCKDATRTQQHHKNEVNINNIIARFHKTGALPEMIKKNPQYGDFTEAKNYHEAMNICLHAQEQFMALNARIRRRFQNDPEQFLMFCNDPKNAPEMRAMGLLKPSEDKSKGSVPKEAPQKPEGKSEGKKEVPKGKDS